MLNSIKKQEIVTVKKMLDTYNDGMKSVESEISVIDEKYRKLAEEEKKHLTAELASLKSEKKVWDKMFKAFSDEDVKEALGEDEPEFDGAGFTAEDNTPVEEEKVVDTIFPENNIEEAVEETVEDQNESVAVEDIPEVSSENTAEDVPVTEGDPWEDMPATEDEKPKVNDLGEVNVDDGWPDFPEEWK